MSIYQEIWDADQAENGIKALRKKDQSQLGEAKVGYVLVDEEARGPDGKVLAEVEIPPEKSSTYDLCRKLFDNYALDPALREEVTEGDSIEEREFIRTIIPTKPIQVAKEFIARDLGQTVTDTDLTLMIKKTWFYQGKAGSKFASGFEHVFVGEQKEKGDQPDTQAVALGGYHFWYKYYLDDGGKDGNILFNDRIDYSGTRYGGGNQTKQGLLVPEVVTLSFRWEAPDSNRRSQLLNKKIGGFWVGCSPEGLIALGLVRVITSAGSSAVINGSTYDVKFFPLSDNSQSIRTFYPVFRRSDFNNINSGEVVTEPGLSSDLKGDVRIAAALVNPEGNESGRETVTLINLAPNRIDLDNWKIKAPNGWEFTFADVTLEAGVSRTFRMSSPSPQFRNKNGAITLLDSDEKVIDRVSYSSEQAGREGYTIKF